MKKKLTLVVEEETVKKAKTYAKANKTSVSEVVEKYLAHITEEEPQRALTEGSVVDKMTNLLEVPDGFDPDKSREDYLKEKHSL